MTGKKIVLTGSSGFLGSVLLGELCSRGHTVECVDRLIGIDVCILKKDDLSWADTVIHLAAETDVIYCEKNPLATMRENAYKTVELCDKLTPRQHFIFASTSAIYGNAHGKRVVWSDEKPNSLYSYSKLVAEKFVEKMNFTILRLATLWGKNTRKNMFISSVIEQAKNGQGVIVFNPETKRAYMNVEDASLEIANIVDFPVYGHINLGTETLKKIDVVSEIARHFGFAMILREPTLFIQDFVMNTDCSGKKFLESFEEML